MIFLVVGICALALALYPRRLAVSGRIMAAFCCTNSLCYFLFVLQGGIMPELGWLGRKTYVETGLFTPLAVTAYLLLALAAFMSFSNRRDIGHLAKEQAEIAIPVAVSYALIAYLTFAGIYIVASLGPDTIMSYRGYGTIKDLDEIYQFNPVGRLVAGTFRFLLMFLIAVAILSLKSRRYAVSCAALLPIAIGCILGVAEASRIISVYLTVAGICFFLIDRKVAGTIAGALAIAFVGYALEARSHYDLGLAYVPQYLGDSLGRGYLLTIVTNVSSTLFVTSASIESAFPSAYVLNYKILSLLPTINLIDHFQAVKDLNEQRIASYLPFNAFAEAWVFGWPYYVYLWVVLFVSGYSVNSSMKYGRIPFAVLLGALLIGILFASQYPLRNSLRYFYALIGLRLVLGYYFRYHARQASRALQWAQIVRRRRQRSAPR